MTSEIPIPAPKKGWRKKQPKSPVQAAKEAQRKIDRKIEKYKTRKASADIALRNNRKKRDALADADRALDGETSTVITTNTIKDLPDDLQEYIAESNIIFQPNPGPQTDFLSSPEQEVLYGGAAGGGKSYAILADAIRDAGNKNHRAIIFRKTIDELRELISKASEMYREAYPEAKWLKNDKTWTFPSGAQVWFTYLERDEDVERYQGQSYNYIAFDELTHWATPYAWDYMRSRLRTTDPKLKLYQRATTNPGGVGAWWVRKMFIDCAEWNKPFWGTDIETGETLRFPPNFRIEEKRGKPLLKRRFIPARLSDNPYLFDDGQYEINLLSMPESQRRQLLDGDWDVVESSAFPEFRRSLHVIEPFEIPNWWTRFRACDWGYRQPACCLWFAVDYDDNVFVYRELYVKGVHDVDFAKLVLDLEEGERIGYGILDGSVWARRGEQGPSIAERMIDVGCRWTPADRRPGSRVSRKLELHRRLSLQDDVDGDPKPSIFFFNNCANLVRTLPMLPVDKNNAEDVDTNAEDHAYDALGYGLASRPMNPRTFMFNDGGSSTSVAMDTPMDSEFGY